MNASPSLLREPFGLPAGLPDCPGWNRCPGCLTSVSSDMPPLSAPIRRRRHDAMLAECLALELKGRKPPAAAIAPTMAGAAAFLELGFQLRLRLDRNKLFL